MDAIDLIKEGRIKRYFRAEIRNVEKNILIIQCNLSENPW